MWFKAIPSGLLRLAGVPEVRYDDTDSKFTINKLVKAATGGGLETLEILHLSLFLFMASVIMVTIVLPNLYFWLMLWADSLVDDQDLYDDLVFE